jgi:hypothetical protein
MRDTAFFYSVSYKNPSTLAGEEEAIIYSIYTQNGLIV